MEHKIIAIQKDNRFEFIDVMKGLTIIIMVMYHLTSFYSDTEVIRDYATPFFMQLFFVLSGLFFSTKSSFGQYLLNKVNRLIVPLFFFYCINYLTFFIVSDIVGLGDKKIISKFHLLYFADLFSPAEIFHYSGAIWFLLCLFNVTIIYYLVNKIKDGYLRLLVSLMISLIGFYMGNRINLPYYLDSAMTMIFFFGLGHFLKDLKFVFKRQSYDYILALVSILLYVILINYFDIYSKVMENEYTGNFALFLLGSILGISSVFFVSRWIRNEKILNFYGKNSLIVLGTHQMVLIVVNMVLMKMVSGLGSVLLLIINLVLSMIIEYFVIIILSKFVPFFVAKKDLIKWKG